MMTTRLNDCPRCGGSGQDPERKVRGGTRRGWVKARCTQCLGLGKVVVELISVETDALEPQTAEAIGALSGEDDGEE